MNSYKNNKTLISIITPIYNSEKYLAKCIDSIRKQSHKNIEIILINDGSTDSSIDICKKYKREDNRIILIDKDNGGAAQARNEGLKIASGDYISFVDSDDCIEYNFISQLLINIEKYNADISVCNYFFDYGNQKLFVTDKPNFRKYNNIDAIKDILLDNSVLEDILCNKLFKRYLFTQNNILLPEGEIYEDTRTIYKLLYYARVIVFSNRPLYYYLQRPNSVMNHSANIRNLLVQLDIPKETEKWLENHSIYLDLEMNAYNTSKQIYAMSYIINDDTICRHMWSNIKNNIRNNLKYIITNPYISKKKKMTCLIIMMGKSPYKILRRIYKTTYHVQGRYKKQESSKCKSSTKKF